MVRSRQGDDGLPPPAALGLPSGTSCHIVEVLVELLRDLLFHSFLSSRSYSLMAVSSASPPGPYSMSCHGSGLREGLDGAGDAARVLSRFTRVPPASRLTMTSGSSTAPMAITCYGTRSGCWGVKHDGLARTTRNEDTNFQQCLTPERTGIARTATSIGARRVFLTATGGPPRMDRLHHRPMFLLLGVSRAPGAPLPPSPS